MIYSARTRLGHSRPDFARAVRSRRAADPHEHTARRDDSGSHVPVRGLCEKEVTAEAPSVDGGLDGLREVGLIRPQTGQLRRAESNRLPPGYEPGELPVLYSATLM